MRSHVAVAKPSVQSAGESLLLGMVGFWDASKYSGSGNWLNLGTGGSSGDFSVPFGSTAPVWTNGNKFVFSTGGGPYSFQFNANHAYHFPDKNAGSFSVGIVQQTPFAIFRVVMGDTAFNGWNVYQDTPSFNARIFSEISQQPQVNGPDEATLTKALRGFVIDDTAHVFKTYSNAVFGTSVADNRAVSPSDGNIFISSPAGAGTWCPQDVYGMFIHQGLLTAQNLTDIGTYFGV